jgi:hypothetical protein
MLLDEQYAIDQELGPATLECLDPSWDEAQLEVDLTQGKTRVSLKPVGREGVKLPSDAVFEAVGRLAKLHRDNATDLKKAIYTFRRQADGTWRFETDFHYAP